MLKEYDKHDKVIHTLNSTTDTYFDQGSYLSLRRGECMNTAIGGGLSNTVDQNPAVSPCFPSENRKSSGVKSYQVYWIHWKRIDSDEKVHFSIRERLSGKISLMLDEGAERRSDGVHRIHWKRIDSDGKAHFSIRKRLRKFHSCCMRG